MFRFTHYSTSHYLVPAVWSCHLNWYFWVCLITTGLIFLPPHFEITIYKHTLKQLKTVLGDFNGFFLLLCGRIQIGFYLPQFWTITFDLKQILGWNTELTCKCEHFVYLEYLPRSDVVRINSYKIQNNIVKPIADDNISNDKCEVMSVFFLLSFCLICEWNISKRSGYQQQVGK